MCRTTPGQQAYEKDLMQRPCYPNGQPRSAWSDLCAIAQWSWERNPTPRKQVAHEPAIHTPSIGTAS